jgi:hypothetical protein
MGPPPESAAAIASVTAPPAGAKAERPARSQVVDLLLVAALGLIVGLACRGHYARPYSDFFEFVDAGHAWLAGELPHTLKRGVVYPVLVVGGARLVPGECPERTVAEWLSVVLVALNGVLIFALVTARIGSAAPWAAAWFLFLPLTAYCTAILLVEPLLTTALLLTALLAARANPWAYIVAALAPLVRLDGAAALVALFVADLIRGRSWRVAVGRTLVSALPLAAWLGLTFLTWSDRSDDHTFARMAAAPTLDILTPIHGGVRATLDATLIEKLTCGLVPATGLWGAIPVLMLGLSAFATVAGVRRRDAAAVGCAAAFVALLFAQAVVPFSVDRYVHPMTALLTGLAALGLGELWHALAPRVPASALMLRRLGQVLLVLALIAAVILLVDHARTWATRAFLATPFEGRLIPIAVIALASAWGLPRFSPCRRMAALAGLVVACAVGAEQIARTSARLGPGDDMKNVVEAARWIRDNAAADAGVLSDDPGLLRAYAGRRPPERFTHFNAIAAEIWPDIIAECRARGVRYIIWHEHMFEHHGGYYAAKYRLERFRPLDGSTAPAGLRVARQFARRPNLTIFEIEAVGE